VRAVRGLARTTRAVAASGNGRFGDSEFVTVRIFMYKWTNLIFQSLQEVPPRSNRDRSVAETLVDTQGIRGTKYAHQG
jgi:hypothetical protein